MQDGNGTSHNIKMSSTLIGQYEMFIDSIAVLQYSGILRILC